MSAAVNGVMFQPGIGTHFLMRAKVRGQLFVSRKFLMSYKAVAIDEHLHQSGKIHKQVAELPEGSMLTDIKIDFGK